jgi:hypothetical protein
MTGAEVTASHYPTVTAWRVNDVVTILSMNDVLNVVTKGLRKQCGTAWHPRSFPSIGHQATIRLLSGLPCGAQRCGQTDELAGQNRLT